MESGYEITKVYNIDLIEVRGPHSTTNWGRTIRDTWKPHECIVCSRKVPARTERMYLPVHTSQAPQGARICGNCVEQKIKTDKQTD